MNENADPQSEQGGESLDLEVKRQVELLCSIGEKLGETHEGPRTTYWKDQVQKTLRKVEGIISHLEASKFSDREKYLYQLKRLRGELSRFIQPF